MHILFVTNKRYPNPRGSSGRLEDLCEELIQRGHRVSVLASMRGHDAPIDGDVSRYRVFEIGGRRLVWCGWRVMRHLKALHPDIVHTQQYDGLGEIARRWALKNNVPWIQTVSDLVSVQKSRHVPDSPNGVIVPAGSLGRMMERNKTLAGDITLIPTGVPQKKFSKGERGLIRTEWSIPMTAQVLLSVSRLTEEKNTEFLFHSLLPMIRADANIYLLCVGGGNLLDSIRDAIIAEGIQERVLFADEVPQERMKHYYAAGDIFVYASKEDFRATVVAEAMYAELPVVAVSSGGSRERVADKVTGFLVSEQADAFAGAVERLLEDPVKMSAFGHSGRILIEESYTVKKNVDALFGAYERAMQERRG